MKQARVKATERDVKPITIYGKVDGVFKELAKVDELSLPAVATDLMKGRIREFLLKKTGTFKSVSNRDKVQVVK